ncbi:MAG: DUF192 domain-containing protein [Treponema sp.]
MKHRLIFLYIIIAVLACAEQSQTFVIKIRRTYDNTEVPIHVEVAITAMQQQRGFMGRKHIPEGTGMLFVYGQDSKLQFWMKNTPHPLSIAFIDSQGRIREIKDMAPYSLAIVPSTYAVRYALEVPQGYFERSQIVVGDVFTAETLELLHKK